MTTKLDYFEENLRDAEIKIEFLAKKNKVLQANQCNSQSDLEQNQIETTKKERDLIDTNQIIETHDDACVTSKMLILIAIL